MRLPRTQVTLRWLMVAVAFAGLAFGSSVLAQRARGFRAKAEKHAAEAEWRIKAVNNALSNRARQGKIAGELRRAKLAGDLHQMARLNRELSACVFTGPLLVDRWRTQAAQHAEAVRTYRHAARYPWLAAPIVPPIPSI
jgi:hypothetical protein